MLLAHHWTLPGRSILCIKNLITHLPGVSVLDIDLGVIPGWAREFYYFGGKIENS